MESSRDDDINQSLEKYSQKRWCTCGRSSLNFPILLSFSFLFNILFVVLFVVVFIRLENVQTRLAKLESPANDPSKLSAKEPDQIPFTLRIANSTLPFAVNVTTPPILLKSMPSLHISRRSTSQTQPTQPTKEKKKVPRYYRDYIKRLVRRELYEFEKDFRSRLRLRGSGMGEPCACKGVKGDPGVNGVKGEKGERGRKGPKGDQGPQGREGMQGRHGINGLPGARGIPGPKGDKGERGPQGDIGTGIKGESGIQGPPGKRGPTGKKGDPGPTGDRGQRGPKGDKGDTGSLESVQRPSAHLTGHTGNTQNSPRSGILRHWKNNLGFAHSSGGMQYSNGELIIPLSGRYYVYSQLYFQVEDDRPYMIHFVHLNRNGTQEVIMRSLSSRCRAKRANTFFYSSYQGGVFELQNGDHILVGVSEGNTKSISAAESASFFGAFLV